MVSASWVEVLHGFSRSSYIYIYILSIPSDQYNMLILLNLLLRVSMVMSSVVVEVGLTCFQLWTSADLSIARLPQRDERAVNLTYTKPFI